MRRLSQPVRKPVEKVVYFVDTYANHFDTQLADALVAVLRHNRRERVMCRPISRKRRCR